MYTLLCAQNYARPWDYKLNKVWGLYSFKEPSLKFQAKL